MERVILRAAPGYNARVVIVAVVAAVSAGVIRNVAQDLYAHTDTARAVHERFAERVAPAVLDYIAYTDTANARDLGHVAEGVRCGTHDVMVILYCIEMDSTIWMKFICGSIVNQTWLVPALIVTFLAPVMLPRRVRNLTCSGFGPSQSWEKPW